MNTNLFEPTIKIFVCTFDKEIRIKNDMFVPLQVGRAVSPVKLDCLGDDTGDNISNKNKYYSEQTGVYWVWKNMKDDHPDYVGFCHYRKYPYMNTGIHQQEIKCTEDFFNQTGGMNIQKIRELVLDNDVLCINPFGYRVSLRYMYDIIHIVEDIDILSKTVKDMFPEYNEAFDKTINAAPSFLYPYNIYVMKWDDFCKYCEFIFPLFKEMENKIDFSKHNGYQSRVFGYMAERLLNVFILKNFKSISTVPCAVIDDYEDPDYTVQDK